MTSRVYKYEVGLGGGIEVPKGADILNAGVQGYGVVIWALVDDSEPETENLDVLVVGTGHAFSTKGYNYLNTVFMDDLVFHVYVESLNA